MPLKLVTRNTFRNALLVGSIALAAAVLVLDHWLADSPLTIIDSRISGDGTIAYAYLGEPLPDLLAENEVKEKRTDASYTVFLGTDEEGRQVYRTRSYAQAAFRQDGLLAWRSVEYAEASASEFARLSHPTVLERMARVVIPRTYATVFYAGAGDGDAAYDLTSPDWNEVHDAVTGTEAGATGTDFGATTVIYNAGNAYFIARAFYPFNTSAIPAAATISAATLNLYVTSKSDQDNDANAFVTIVQTSQASISTLATADYDQCGAINSPTEGIATGERKDITAISTSAYLSFTLNSTGLSWVGKNGQTTGGTGCQAVAGMTCLGMREGHDVLDDPVGSTDQLNEVITSSSEASGSSQDPYLDVTYSIVLEQEGFRWRADDGDEDAASWLEAQDTDITREANLGTRLRLLLNAPSVDPASLQYQLEYREDSATVWQKVISASGFPTVAATSTTAVTTGTSMDVSMPSGILAGDLLLIFACEDAPGTGLSVSGWTELFENTWGGNTSAAARIVRHAAWAKIAVGADTATITTDVSQDKTAIAVRISKHGVSDVATDIKVGTAATTSASSAPNPPNLDASSTKKWLWIESHGADGDENIAAYETAGYTGLAQVVSTEGTSSCMSAAAYLNSETQTLNPGNMAMAASEEWIAQTIAIPPFIEQVTLSASANITASGENTTVQLTAPAGKATSDFDAGRIQDDENPADTVDITSDDYTEMEWSIIAVTGVAQDGDNYQFRITASDTLLSTYTLTPEWTIGTTPGGGGGEAAKIIRLQGGRFHGVRLQ